MTQMYHNNVKYEENSGGYQGRGMGKFSVLSLQLFYKSKVFLKLKGY